MGYIDNRGIQGHIRVIMENRMETTSNGIIVSSIITTMVILTKRDSGDSSRGPLIFLLYQDYRVECPPFLGLGVQAQNGLRAQSAARRVADLEALGNTKYAEKAAAA